MKRIISVTILLFILVSLSAHPWKPRHYVIVDTDAGVDDLKTLCMLLASPDVRVLAVTVSDGYRKSDDAYGIVREMTDSLWHEGLIIVKKGDAVRQIEKVLSQETMPVTFIALGSLKTAADAIDNAPLFSGRVKQIIWSNDGLPGKEGFNYRSSPEAADKVLDGPLPVIVIHGGIDNFYDKSLLEHLKEISTPCAAMVYRMIASRSGHAFVFMAYDELVALYVHYPSLFIVTRGKAENKLVAPSDTNALRQAALTILKGETVQRMQIIKSMPDDTSFYMPDLQPYVKEIREKYGEDEWTSGVIGNELHRHLGVMAIIGVKMGIRAREYFCTGVDEMSVKTYAGSTPPLSCMNDGLQVSTGATPGHGLLEVSTETSLSPSADFTYRDRTIRITLKKELADKVMSELKEINFVYGLDSDLYWELVRKNTLKYWLQFDRHEIFNIEVIR